MASRVPVGDSAAAQQTGAFHGPSYGLDAELKDKMDSKYDVAQEQSIREWMASKGVPVEGDFHAALKNGIKLCELANALHAGSVARIQKAAAPFVQMENIANFLKAAEHLGVRKNELFQTVDLFEAKNMSAVLVTLGALKRSKP
ncbi:basic calponin isoform 4, putative [Acanthamoeba castellanii str. Neff]|uniref:Basic calponin isoform 4, putative n=1 Tax=Acanthamoeba castellanii (strain ATCC 30010 / Neff) TaxID=1257118 RepID=L8GSF5_ACACF|nr:basic calponin isoform 4, putative [Acanthamoeba castellanii str. Neff]ELR15882.1 basic calponin isoform 4, putative [Acanthamoeba castellanii str. Neff]